MTKTAPDPATDLLAQPHTTGARIERIEPMLVDRFLFVLVHTDDGLVGVGESGAWGHLEASHAAMRKLGDALVGEDPSRIEHHWNVMTRFSHFRGTAIMGAVSAIDMALWDLLGKRLGVSVATLLGGRVRDRARVYAHVKARTIEAMVADCLALKARGLTAIGHLNPFLDEDKREPYFKPYARKMRDAVDNVRAVREAVGDDVDLCIEIHRRLTPAEAIAFAREIEPFRPMFLEDPIRPDNLDAMAEIAQRTTIPIATGERFMSLYEFSMLLARGGVKYVRASLCVCGGITAGRKIAAIAEAHGAELVPHNPLSPVCLAASLQLAAAIPNFAIQEYPTSTGGADGFEGLALRGRDLVQAVPEVTDGFITIPATAGLGIELSAAARVQDGSSRPLRMRRHRDGSVIDQ